MKQLKQNKKDCGFILIDKKSGPSSHSIVNQLRKITGIKKIGHAGTLDPFASGLMILGISRGATKNINLFLKLDKKYEADVFLGKSTDTYDRCGQTIFEYQGKKPTKENIQKNIVILANKKTQIPPMYSAKKVGGKKLYELARKNIEIKRRPQKIKIFYIKIIKYNWPILKLKIHCSSGTYIRTIADDLGKKLKCGAHLQELRRTEIGKYKIKKAIEIEKINENNFDNFLFQIKNPNKSSDQKN